MARQPDDGPALVRRSSTVSQMASDRASPEAALSHQNVV